MSVRRSAVVILVLASLAGGVFAKKKTKEAGAPEGLEPVSFDAAYTMMIDAAELKPASPCMAVSKVVGEDGLETREPVGKRKFEAGAGPEGESAITMSGDLAAWIASGAKTIVEASGVKTGSTGPLLVVRLKSLTMTEEKHDNSVWHANLTLGAELRLGSGATCWSNEYWGAGKNWGDPENRVNYQETVNRALDRALADLLKDAAFAEALCNKCK